MEVSYKSENLRNSVETERKREKKYRELSSLIKIRIDMLKTVDNLNEVSHLPPINRHKLKGDFKNCFAIYIERNGKNRIVFEPVGIFDNSDLSTMDAIKIVYIGDYH